MTKQSKSTGVQLSRGDIANILDTVSSSSKTSKISSPKSKAPVKTSSNTSSKVSIKSSVKTLIKPLSIKPSNDSPKQLKDVAKSESSAIKPKLVVKPIIIKPASKPDNSLKNVKNLAKISSIPKISVSKNSKKPTPMVSTFDESKNVEAQSKPTILDVPEHEAYFVYLKNPLECRKYLLDGSRKILLCLRSYQKILLIRRRKLEELSKLKNSVKELLYLNKKFNEKLPKYNLNFLEPQMQDIGAKQKSKNTPLPVIARKPIEQKREKTELERLEESLASIESKLKSLQ